MAEFQESSIKLPSICSEMRDSAESLNLEAGDGDEEFYEEIEAPKFVDFTAPHHYCPDDRYWFCLRVGCDQKHEEEMDSEKIYKNFVLRVMAARSPNIRLRKALDRNASRSPSKCPLSAPPKPSRPRLSNLAIMSSFSKMTGDGKNGIVRSLLKPKPSTPMLKTKPVAAKYLTTPRNKACRPNQSLFRSVQNPKTTKTDEPKSARVVKALVFRSPRKKAVKVKTSLELRTPISKLCEGMSKLDLSQRKRTLGYLSKASKNLGNTPLSRRSGHKAQGKPQGSSVSSQACTSHEGKSGRSVKSKVKAKLEQHVPPKKLLGHDRTNSSKKNHGVKKQLSEKVAQVNEVKATAHDEPCISSEVGTSTINSHSALLSALEGKGNCEDLEGNEKSISQATEGLTMNSNDGNGKGSSEETCGESIDRLNIDNSSKDQNHEDEFMDGDDKENAAASNDEGNSSNSSEDQKQDHESMDSDDKENAAVPDKNRINNKNMKPTGSKLFRVHDKCSQVKREVAQVENKSLKEGSVSSAPATKLKKPKPTNPKPFRLRTDERGILKEANLERKTDSPTPGSENANVSTPNGRKRGSGSQAKNTIIDQKVPKGGLQTSKAATPESNKHQDTKSRSSPLERLEKFRKMNSPIQKHTVKPQGTLSSAKKEMSSFLVPGQKLEVIHEVSPEVWKTGKQSGNTTPPPIHDSSDCFAPPRSSSSSPSPLCGSGRRPVTVAREPNFHSTHVPRSCIKNLNR